jgi:hypothetical protein
MNWVAWEERLSNPTLRALQVAVRVPEAGQIRQRVRLNLSVVTCPGLISADWPRQDTLPSLAQSAFQIGALHVGEGAVETVHDARRWTIVKLGPGESTRLRWYAHPAPGTPVCPLPVEKHEVTCPSAGLSSHETRSVDFRWQVSAVEMSGRFWREARVADGEESFEELTQEVPPVASADFVSLPLETLSREEARGSVGTTTQDFACQGVFW